ncbi:arabinose-5-phosphate isomerase GutQ [Gilliamella sp. B2776]|uniref:arabinose-5-phosphate isomerase GutQ n=1 Tax=unclassified Gilliamella TaxID=2685620 RepID=UPI00226AC5A5|nr:MULTISPECIES: arabinose-5-phosphate isomerase GutQ [unclassified Gilliamella]MCX8649307.1 arabinose-5-phosphate isomerase GutQ [Gilliamella sp. B2779]MCX8655079.1 arabinose-5-phosphate isomerase GutQ [Gilliamella sp. B2737]MCX8655851.1 arabinose-5-phosphate isomerase GutQ [Gilliamella sp. B2894]MCX8691198.1 arabinose-5-phosphate isomerase GutQ [Gilliamella sp. B2776]MCX8694604.1 arabinose-5-phosphate isomerase GutQ [Gilliamella sp. B2881]
MNKLLQYGRELLELELQEAQKLPDRLGKDFIEACQLILSNKGKVVVSGIGKSGHIGKKIAASLASTGSPAFFMHPSEALHGDLGMVTKNDVAILISYSGRAKEFNFILPMLSAMNVPVIAITGGLDSPLAKSAQAVLDVSIEQEACPMGLAPTSSSTNTLLMGDALAIAVMRARGFKEEDFARSHPAGSLGAKLLNHVKDVMRQGDLIPKVPQTATVFDAMLELSRTGVGLVAICQDNNKIIGVFTDGDLRRLLLKNGTLQDSISSVMTSPGYQIPESWKAVEALKSFNDHNITAAPVVNSSGELVGALNIHDLHQAGIS